MHHLPSFPAGVFAKSQKDSRWLGFFLPATASWGGLKPPGPQVAVNGYPEDSDYPEVPILVFVRPWTLVFLQGLSFQPKIGYHTPIG
jgi:hypothetical protein